MSIFEDVRKRLISSRKHKMLHGGEEEHIRILSTLLGELELKAVLDESGIKTVSDEVAISLIKKNIKSLDEMITFKPEDNKLKYEKSYLQTFLPSQLSEQELKREIAMLILANEEVSLSMAEIMNHLKKNFSGRYDGKTASILAKELLNKGSL